MSKIHLPSYVRARERLSPNGRHQTEPLSEIGRVARKVAHNATRNATQLL